MPKNSKEKNECEQIINYRKLLKFENIKNIQKNILKKSIKVF